MRRGSIPSAGNPGPESGGSSKAMNCSLLPAASAPLRSHCCDTCGGKEGDIGTGSPTATQSRATQRLLPEPGARRGHWRAGPVCRRGETAATSVTGGARPALGEPLSPSCGRARTLHGARGREHWAVSVRTCTGVRDAWRGVELGWQHRYCWHTAHCGSRGGTGSGTGTGTEHGYGMCLYQGWAGVAVEHFCGVRGHFPEPGDGTDRQEVRTASNFSPSSHLFHSALQKLLAECQDQQWCQFSVHSQVFGPDPCPGTHKYLIASYKCRPGEVEHGLDNTAVGSP